MEILFWVFIIYVILVLLRWLIGTLKNGASSINWGKFFLSLIIGSILLALIFSFTAEGVLVILGFYILLIFGALIYGIFSNKNKEM